MSSHPAVRSHGPPSPHRAGAFLLSGQEARSWMLDAEPGSVRMGKEDREEEGSGDRRAVPCLSKCSFGIWCVTPAQRLLPGVTSYRGGIRLIMSAGRSSPSFRGTKT